MKLYAPPYYTEFTCIGEKCKHNCCIGWEITVDQESLSRYKDFEGELGALLRDKIAIDDAGDTIFRLTEDERCPMLNACGLCRIILEKGEDALCNICAMHPRYRNDVANRIELGLGLCCEEAVRLVLSDQRCPIPIPLDLEPRIDPEDLAEESAADEDDDALLALRDQILTRLYDRQSSLREALYSIAHDLGAELPVGRISDWESFFRSLNRLDAGWNLLLDRLRGDDRQLSTVSLTHREAMLRPFAAYLINRYFLIYDSASIFSFILLAVHFLAALSEYSCEFPDAVRQFSAEIEYDEDNFAALISALTKE